MVYIPDTIHTTDTSGYYILKMTAGRKFSLIFSCCVRGLSIHPVHLNLMSIYLDVFLENLME